MHLRRILILLLSATAVFFGRSAHGGGLTVNVIYSFTNNVSPNSGLVIDAKGNFHGTLSSGGPNNLGGIYEVTSNGVLASLVYFDGKPNGGTPLAPLVLAANGDFYGTTSSGGPTNSGTVFQVTPSGQFKLLATFYNTNGSTSEAPLLVGTNGWLYGTTFNGGSDGLGEIYQVSATSGLLSNVYSFTDNVGENPAAGLMQGHDGNLYGTTQFGGSNGLGTIFQLTYGGTITTLASFNEESGAFPGGLVEDAFGNFYGTTINGGSNFAGTVFELDRFGLENLFSFDITNGANPNSPLIIGNDDLLYGTTQEGGEFGAGTIYRMTPFGQLQTLVSFNGADGALPRSGIIQSQDGNFYGTTSQGGAYGFGEIYQLTGFPPVITKEPSNAKWITNGTAQFSVGAAGSTPLIYQWTFDGIPISGATNSALLVADEQLTNSGTYSVTVSNPYGFVVSSNAVLTVPTPLVSVIPPLATVTNASLTISGTASDPVGIASVQYQLNSNGWLTASGTAHWQAVVSLQPGVNIFQAQSLDPLGNPSAVKTATTFYATMSSLTLLTNGLGSIAPGFKGTNLIIDKTYTVHATPGKGQLFLSWTGTTNSTANPLTFFMQSNMVLQANFVTNPFIATAATYTGLFYNPDAIGAESSGLLSSLTLQNTGAYSATMLLNGTHYGFSGSFSVANLQSSPTVARVSSQGGPLTLSMTLNSNQIIGTLSGTNDGGWTSPLFAERVSPFIGSGEYTLLLPPGAGAPTESPPGYGYALITNNVGHVTLSGAVADGGTFSQIVSTVGGGDVPFYASLYDNTGLVIGWLNVNGSLTASNLWWIKTSSTKTAIYTNGFTNLIATALTSTWTKPAAGYLTGGTLSISNENLNLDFTVSITNSSLIKQAGSPTNSLTGIFNPKTGLLQVTFGNGVGKATTLGYCAILGDTTNGGGYFAIKTNAGAITLGP